MPEMPLWDDSPEALELELLPHVQHGCWTCPACLRERRARYDQPTPLAGTIMESLCRTLFRWSGDQEKGIQRERCKDCEWHARNAKLKVCWSCGATKERA